MLVQRACAGDAGAFELLVRRHQAEVHRLALRLAPNRSDAEEIAQETFLQAFRALAAYRGDASFRTWLYRIASRVVLMRRRAARRRPTEPLRDDPAQLEDAGGLARGAARPARADDLLERKELGQVLQDALDRLGGAYRPVVELRDLEGLSSSAAAAALGVTSEVVRQRLRRAHLMLRGRLAHARLAGGA